MFIIIAPMNTHEKHHIRLHVNNIVCYYAEIFNQTRYAPKYNIVFQLTSPFKLPNGDFEKKPTNTKYLLSVRDGNIELNFNNLEDLMEQLNKFDDIMIKCQKMKEILNG